MITGSAGDPRTEAHAQQAQALCAANNKLPITWSLKLAPTVTLDLALIPNGAFLMGQPTASDPSGEAGPLHRVVIPTPFYMGVTPITQQQWLAVDEANPALFTNAVDLPIEMVSWNGYVAFCAKLSAQLGQRVRLPSEAEWEYACRAGSRTIYHFGDDPAALIDYGWCRVNAHQRSRPVGHKQPNPWGLYDMHGGIDEFCQDHWHPSYSGAPNDGRAWVADGNEAHRVLRGGSWYDLAEHCTSGHRNYYPREIGTEDHGVRVVVELP